MKYSYALTALALASSAISATTTTGGDSKTLQTVDDAQSTTIPLTVSTPVTLDLVILELAVTESGTTSTVTSSFTAITSDSATTVTDASTKAATTSGNTIAATGATTDYDNSVTDDATAEASTQYVTLTSTITNPDAGSTGNSIEYVTYVSTIRHSAGSDSKGTTTSASRSVSASLAVTTETNQGKVNVVTKTVYFTLSASPTNDAESTVTSTRSRGSVSNTRSKIRTSTLSGYFNSSSIDSTGLSSLYHSTYNSYESTTAQGYQSSNYGSDDASIGSTETGFIYSASTDSVSSEYIDVSDSQTASSSHVYDSQSVGASSAESTAYVSLQARGYQSDYLEASQTVANFAQETDYDFGDSTDVESGSEQTGYDANSDFVGRSYFSPRSDIAEVSQSGSSSPQPTEADNFGDSRGNQSAFGESPSHSRSGSAAETGNQYSRTNETHSDESFHSVSFSIPSGQSVTLEIREYQSEFEESTQTASLAALETGDFGLLNTRGNGTQSYATQLSSGSFAAQETGQETSVYSRGSKGRRTGSGRPNQTDTLPAQATGTGYTESAQETGTGYAESSQDSFSSINTAVDGSYRDDSSASSSATDANSEAYDEQTSTEIRRITTTLAPSASIVAA